MMYREDATPAWNGFNYQGKVSGYVTLCIINSCIKKGKRLEGYALETEGVEDFAILKEGKYISIHQVKAYNQEYSLGKYKDAIWKLIGKTMDKNVEEAMLHTACSINNYNPNTDSGREAIKNLNPTKNPNRSKNKAFDYKNKYINNSGLDEGIKKLVPHNSESDSNSKFSLCIKLNKIEEKIKEQITTFYENINVTTNADINSAYLHLLGRIDNHINERHQGNTENLISFNKIAEHISFGNIRTDTKEYYCYFFREGIQRMKDAYCGVACECVSEGEDGTVCKECNVAKITEKVKLLGSDELIDFIKTINPTESMGTKINPYKFAKFMQRKGYVSGFFECLKKINASIEIGKSIITYRDTRENKLVYAPTTIHFCGPGTTKELGSIAQKILENKDAIESLFDFDVLISADVNIESIGNEAKIITDVGSEANEQYKISKMKNTCIKEIETVKGVLNSE